MQNHTTSTYNSTESRALELLGSGLGAEIVANACGVTVSRISQLLSEPEFAAQVSELRFNNLQKHNVRDSSYDALEDTLIERMRDLLPLMLRPMEILKAIAIINGAKRRGQSAPEVINASNTVVTLVMPKQIIQNFTVNMNNQVIKAGNQELITVQSGHMNTMLKNREASDENGYSGNGTIEETCRN